MNKIVIRLAILHRRLQFAVYRLRYPDIDKITLRSMLYIDRQGRKLRANTLPEYYLKLWSIPNEYETHYEYARELLYCDTRRELGTCTPYVISCFLYSRYSWCRSNRWHTLGYRFKPEYQCYDDMNFEHLSEQDDLFRIILSARRSGKKITNVALWNVDLHGQMGEYLHAQLIRN